ncbi:11611_t:CDS:2, partial [Ambispora leptoticha]
MSLKEEITKNKLLDQHGNTIIAQSKTVTNLQIRISDDQQVFSSTSSSTFSSSNVSGINSSNVDEIVTVSETVSNTCITKVKDIDSNGKRHTNDKELILEKTDIKVTIDRDTQSSSYNEKNKVHRSIVQITNIATRAAKAMTTKTESGNSTRKGFSHLFKPFLPTETVEALREFVQLFKREWHAKEKGEESLEDIGSFGRIIETLSTWAFLQDVTVTRWGMEMGGWKKIKLADFREFLDHDSSIYDGKENEEIALISSKNDDNNIVIGELTQQMHDLSNECSKRELCSDAFNNPYMDDLTEEKKSYSSLLHNLKRYSKFSSTAYDIKTVFRRNRAHKYFSRANNLSLESIVYSSFQNSPSGTQYSPTYYIIRDHSTKSIILAIRGTMSIHDLIVDLSCEYEDFILPEDTQNEDSTPNKVHSGIMKAARALATPGQSLFETLKRELEQNEDYGIVLIGHSLGAGIASLLALLWASPETRMTTRWSHLPLGRRVHAYAFATPCV